MDREEMEKKTENEIENEEMTIEEAFAQLDELTRKMENSQTSLEDSFALYQRGMELLKLCSDKIDRVEKKMLQIDEDGIISEF